jgi:hypothetical protein
MYNYFFFINIFHFSEFQIYSSINTWLSYHEKIEYNLARNFIRKKRKKERDYIYICIYTLQEENKYLCLWQRSSFMSKESVLPMKYLVKLLNHNKAC